jgi:hypothetical protein
MKGNSSNQRQSQKTRKQNKHTCGSMDDKNHNNKTMKKTKTIEKPNLM